MATPREPPTPSHDLIVRNRARGRNPECPGDSGAPHELEAPARRPASVAWASRSVVESQSRMSCRRSRVGRASPIASATACSSSANPSAFARSSRRITASTPLSPSSRWGSRARRVVRVRCGTRSGWRWCSAARTCAEPRPGLLADLPQQRPDGAGLAEHREVLLGQVPEAPSGGPGHERVDERADPDEGVVHVAPPGLVEATVQALGEQHVGVGSRARRPGVEPRPAERRHLHPPSLGGARRAEPQPAQAAGVADDRATGPAPGAAARDRHWAGAGPGPCAASRWSRPPWCRIGPRGWAGERVAATDVVPTPSPS